MSIDQVPLSEQAHSLAPAQHGEPVHRVDDPIPVLAWIHTRKGHQLVEGVALAWTPKAAHVRYIDEHGRDGFTWLGPTPSPGGDHPSRPVQSGR